MTVVEASSEAEPPNPAKRKKRRERVCSPAQEEYKVVLNLGARVGTTADPSDQWQQYE
jgi:hypothetical protein